MKSIKTSSIISHSLHENPLIDRMIQSTILHIIGFFSNDYGYNRAPVPETLLVTNKLLKENFGLDPISSDNFKKYLTYFNNYGVTIEEQNGTICFEPFILQDTEPRIRIEKEQLDKHVSDVFRLYVPVHLIEKIEKNEKDIESLSRRQIEFLSTSKLHKMREISDKLGEIVDSAKDHIYIMLAFYQEDISFFANFLGNKVKADNLDLKIIYRHDDPKNRIFIQRLYEKLGSGGFFRVYNSENLKGSFQQNFIGNLHSKAVMTENELLVGSANLTAHSMYYNIENAIYTNDEVSVKKANIFFLNLWNRLREPIAI